MDARTQRSSARVVIYGARPDANRALRELLVAQEDVDGVIAVTGAESAMRALRAGADILLIDATDLADPNVPEILEALAHMRNETPVVLLGVPPATVELVRAVTDGPVGIATSPTATGLARTLRRLVRGEPTTANELVGPYLTRLVAERRQREADAAALESLTNRELTVLQLLSEGRRRNEIAAELGISPNTIRTHLTNIMQKLGTHSQLLTAMRGRELLGFERPAVIKLPEQVAVPRRPSR